MAKPGKEIFINKKTLEVLETVPEEIKGDVLEVGKVDDLTLNLTDEQLQGLVAKVRGEKLDTDGNSSKKKLAAEIFTLITGKKKSAKGAKKEAKPRAESKLSKLRAELIPGKNVTKEYLSEKSGYDLPNTHTAMSILKNPGRTKDPVFFLYNRADQSYDIFKDKATMDAAIKTMEEAKAKSEKAEKKDKGGKDK